MAVPTKVGALDPTPEWESAGHFFGLLVDGSVDAATLADSIKLILDTDAE